jgi:hypothetical protein
MSMTWTRAQGPDVAEMRTLSESHFAEDNNGLFVIDHSVFDHNVTRGIVDQFYNPLSELILVARDGQGSMQAWTWVSRGERVLWSSEEMAAVRMVHVNLTLTPRQRIEIIKHMMTYWEFWAYHCGIRVLCSTSMRADQEGFLRLHERAGYIRRGSICYKRLEPVSES